MRPSTIRAPLGFRWAGPGDVDAVVTLVESAFRGERSRGGWTTEADLLDGQRTDRLQVTSVIGSADGRILLAEAGGVTVGCCELHGGGSRRPAHLGMLAVRPDLQGGGVGGAVMREAEAAATTWSAPEMRLMVIRQRTELIAWYARRGYHPTGDTAPFPYGDPRFGLPRRDDLEFVVLSKPLP